MNQQENTNAVVFNAPQETNHPSGCRNAEVRKHYFHHQLLLNPNATAQLSDDAWLISFKRRAERFADMLTFLEQSWVEGMPVLQKACFSYLTEDYIPRKERQQVIEAWSNWADFQFKLSRYRGLASLFLRYQRRMIREIECLLPPPSAESQTIHQEGGR